MNTTTNSTILALTALAALALPASAAITSTSGGVTQIGPPAACGPGQLTSLFQAFAWDEQQNVTTTGVICDETQNPGGSAAPTFGVLTGVYDSHFIHFQGIPINNAAGSVTFNGFIVGVMWNNIFLDISDGQSGALGTIYPTGYPFRGILAPNATSVVVNANVLNFNFQNFFTPNDLAQIRVFTQVPAPGACGLLAAGGFLAARRRR